MLFPSGLNATLNTVRFRSLAQAPWRCGEPERDIDPPAVLAGRDHLGPRQLTEVMDANPVALGDHRLLHGRAPRVGNHRQHTTPVGEAGLPADQAPAL